MVYPQQTSLITRQLKPEGGVTDRTQMQQQQLLQLQKQQQQIRRNSATASLHYDQEAEQNYYRNEQATTCNQVISGAGNINSNSISSSSNNNNNNSAGSPEPQVLGASGASWLTMAPALVGSHQRFGQQKPMSSVVFNNSQQRQKQKQQQQQPQYQCQNQHEKSSPYIKDDIDIVFNRLMALEAFRKLPPTVIRNLCSYAFVERIDKGVIGKFYSKREG